MRTDDELILDLKAGVVEAVLELNRKEKAKRQRLDYDWPETILRRVAAAVPEQPKVLKAFACGKYQGMEALASQTVVAASGSDLLAWQEFKTLLNITHNLGYVDMEKLGGDKPRELRLHRRIQKAAELESIVLECREFVKNRRP